LFTYLAINIIIIVLIKCWSTCDTREKKKSVYYYCSLLQVVC